MRYDFPDDFVREQIAYYGLSENADLFARFLSSPGLNDVDGMPKASWNIFEGRGRLLQYAKPDIEGLTSQRPEQKFIEMEAKAIHESNTSKSDR